MRHRDQRLAQKMLQARIRVKKRMEASGSTLRLLVVTIFVLSMLGNVLAGLMSPTTTGNALERMSAPELSGDSARDNRDVIDRDNSGTNDSVFDSPHPKTPENAAFSGDRSLLTERAGFEPA